MSRKEGPRAVLIVDDEVALREVFARALRQAGYSIVAAESAEQALILLGEHPVDAILSDVQMPDMDGLELARRIRGTGNFVPIVLVTGAPNTEAASSAAGLGAIRYLPKPVAPEALRSVMAEIMAAAECG